MQGVDRLGPTDSKPTVSPLALDLLDPTWHRLPDSVLALALAWLVALDPIRIEGDSPRTDLGAAARGVEVRLAPSSDDWRVVATEVGEDQVRLQFTPPRGEGFERTVALEASTPTERGRELATAVTVIIEQHELPPSPEPAPPPPEPAPPPALQSPPPRPVGWVGVGGHVDAGAPSRPDLAYGTSLAGGAWLLRGHLQPRLEIGWSRSAGDGLTVDAVRLMAGAAAGATVARGRLWLGGGVMGGAVGSWARAQGLASGWAARIAIPAVVQARLGRFVVGAHLGPQLTLPRLRFLGDDTTLRWGRVRFVAGIQVGLTFFG